MGFEFKVYINGGREFFAWQSDIPFITKQKKEKDFELSQTLLDFLDLELGDDFYDMTIQTGKEIQALYEPDEEHNLAFLREKFDFMAGQHVLFELLRLDWYERLDKFKNGEIKDPHKEMFYKEITHLQAKLRTWQNEIRNIISKALDALSSNNPVQDKLALLYERQAIHETFTFEPLLTTLERVDKRTFTEVLRPESMREIIDFLLRAAIRQELTFKTCRSCGRYFPNTVHGNSEYCERIFQGTDKTCKEIGSVKVYQAKVEENPEYKLYNRAYKSHFARIKYKRMTKEQFKDWAVQARKFRDEVSEGKMRLEEYERWCKW